MLASLAASNFSAAKVRKRSTSRCTLATVGTAQLLLGVNPSNKSKTIIKTGMVKPFSLKMDSGEKGLDSVDT
jgi:hypothetical protein